MKMIFLSLPRILICAAAACLAMYSAVTAQAGPITIQNYSFENATYNFSIGSYGYQVAPSSWQNAGSTLTGGTGYGISVVTDTGRYTGGGYDGANSLAIHVDPGAGGVTGTAWVSTVSLGTYALNTVYSLTVAAVAYNTSDPNRNSIIAFGTDGTNIGSTVASLTSNNTSFANWQAFKDITLTFDTTGTTGIVGQNIVVFLAQNITASATYGGDMYYDNVRLTSAVPEPATWALLAFSLTGVAVFRRRRLG